MNGIIIIPVIHGRDFWEKPVRENLGKEHIVFLGDYLDPYEYEGIASWEVFPHFEDIVALKKENPDDVTLLLGNHDLHYLDGDLGGSRYDYIHGARNKKFILDNLSLFQMAYEADVAGKKYLFSHAGVMWGWLVANRHLLGTIIPENVCEKLNGFLQDRESWPRFFRALGDVSHTRGGPYRHGSVIWSDVDEWEDKYYELPNNYQIFGHTQQEIGPVIGKHFACLDCRRTFRLTENDQLQDLQRLV